MPTFGYRRRSSHWSWSGADATVPVVPFWRRAGSGGRTATARCRDVAALRGVCVDGPWLIATIQRDVVEAASTLTSTEWRLAGGRAA
jgi:hypothetical protein